MTAKNIDDIYALTPLQEGLLFHTISDAVSGAYFDQYCCTFNADVNADSLKRAWELLVERHSAMRTLFTWEKRDKPLQLVRKRVDLPWQELDWSAKSAHDQAGALQRFLEQDRERGFELDKAPLTRITLIRLADARWRMVWSFHHLVLDGWSVRLLLGELRQLYNKLERGEEAELGAAPQFRQFVDWCVQRETRPEKDYFASLLDGFDTPTCPTIYSSARATQATQGVAASGMEELEVQDALYIQLSELAKTHRVTLNTVMVAAWSILLGNYCDANDVVFGTTVAGRPVEMQSAAAIAGLFINTLTMRIRMSAQDSVGELFQRVQTEQVQQRRFEQASLSEVRRHSDVPAGTDLFETLVVFENFPKFNPDGATAAGDNIPGSNLPDYGDEDFVEYSNFPLALLVVPENKLRLILVHQFERFEQTAARQILASLAEILAQLAANPEAKLRSLSMLSTDELDRITNIWGRSSPASESSAILGSRSIHPNATNVLQLIEHQAEQRPEAIACTSASDSLTYAALEQRANHYAAMIINNGGRERGVVIIGERDIPAIIAIVAALKAGAVYALLDAGESMRRIEFVLNDFRQAFGHSEDVKPPVVITQKHLAGSVSQFVDELCLIESIDANDGAVRPSTVIGSYDAAYVIYTSGSTGNPKGVLIEHSSLLNSVQARFNYYSEPVDAYALVSSLSTDSAIAGIYWTLCSGGNLILPASRAELDVESLGDLIFNNKVSHILCVPTLYALMLEHCDSKKLSHLNTVIVAGENCPSVLVSQHFNRLPAARLFNEYGPSETCVWASVAELTAASAGESVTIGKPIDGVQIYILDRWMNPVPAGVNGEIYIGGRNLARGYLNNADLSNAVFTLNPFTTEKDDRLYRTGDRGRFRADGNIEFAGRVDNQIKVRGYRVEPGEVESALLSHENVSEVVVMLNDSHVIEQALDDVIESTDADQVSAALESVLAAQEVDYQ